MKTPQVSNFFDPSPYYSEEMEGGKDSDWTKNGRLGQEPIFVKVYMILAKTQEKLIALFIEMPYYNLV